jgi:hypothetical protein
MADQGIEKPEFVVMENFVKAVRVKNPQLYKEIIGEMKKTLLLCRDDFIQFLELNEEYKYVIPSDKLNL